jgi:uncharacterized protein (DUF169 family)
MVSNKELTEKFTSTYKLKYPPIAFFYTDNPPQEVLNPKKARKLENRPCISQFMNSVINGKILVLGKDSKNLCGGGLYFLGYPSTFSKAKEMGSQYHSGGVKNQAGDVIMDGEHGVKTPEIAMQLYEDLPRKEAPADYAVFMPLDQVDSEKYKPVLVIFFVNMDQLSGLIMLSKYDTSNYAKLAFGSNCTSFILEPLLELDKGDPPRAVVGSLTECVTRRYVPKDIATITIGYKRLFDLYENIDESFLKTSQWKVVEDRT